MDCPNCESTRLDFHSIGPSRSGSQCPRCGGVWFERDAAYWIAERGVRPGRKEPVSKACPGCGRPELLDVVLDCGVAAMICHHCGGLWCESKGVAILAELPPPPDSGGGWLRKLAIVASFATGAAIMIDLFPSLHDTVLNMDDELGALLIFVVLAVVFGPRIAKLKVGVPPGKSNLKRP
jgi:hypothetical protein